MAPFYFEHCPTCARETKHWHRDPREQPSGGDCDECGGFTPAVPDDDLYHVSFTNRTDLSVEAAPGEYFLGTTQKANSERAALVAALHWAIGVRDRVGLPPHGLRIEEEELRNNAIVIPDRVAFHEGYWETLALRLRQHHEGNS